MQSVVVAIWLNSPAKVFQYLEPLGYHSRTLNIGLKLCTVRKTVAGPECAL